MSGVVGEPPPGGPDEPPLVPELQPMSKAPADNASAARRNEQEERGSVFMGFFCLM
jgi:hypothetical protein